MTQELQILGEVAQRLNGTLEIGTALEAVLTRLAEHFGLTTGWVWLADGEGFSLGTSKALPRGFLARGDWTAGTCWCQSMYLEGQLDDETVRTIQCSRLAGLESGTEGFRYHTSVALEANGERLGILNLARPDFRELESEEVQLLRTVADMLAVAIQRAQLFSQSRETGALEERARLSREMHDGVAQKLVALTLQLEALEAAADAPLAARVRKSLALARETLDDARRAVMDLRESPFAGRAFEVVVAELIAAFEARTGIRVERELALQSEPPLRVRHAVARVLEEGLANVARHSAAKNVAVEVDVDERGVRLLVEDDGGGLTEDAEGHGLKGMRERAALLGGTLEVESTSGGTTLRLEVPS